MSKTTPKHREVRHSVEIRSLHSTHTSRNYLKYPRKQLDLLRESLKRFGQDKSIVVQDEVPDSYQRRDQAERLLGCLVA